MNLVLDEVEEDVEGASFLLPDLSPSFHRVDALLLITGSIQSRHLTSASLAWPSFAGRLSSFSALSTGPKVRGPHVLFALFVCTVWF